MSQYPRVDPDCTALLSTDGTKTNPDENGDVTLTIATFYFPLGIVEAPLYSVQLRTDAVIAGVFTLETCNFPREGFPAGKCVADWENTIVGNWIKQDPTTAFVATVGTGWAIANLTLTKTAGTGGADLEVGNLGARRARIKAVISIGGKVRVGAHGKM